MLRTIGLLALVLAGCEQHDYGVQVEGPGTNHAIANFPETISARFDISIDVAFQRSNFGQDVSRCQFQVALYYYYQSDFFGEGGGGHPTVDFPSEEGDCLLSEFPDHPDSDPRDNWRVRGTIDAGETILLIGEEEDIELLRMQDGEDRVYYDLEGCDAESFPFAKVLDLSAPEANMGSDYDALYLENAIVTSPMLTVTSPGPDLLEKGYVYHPNGSDFEMVWEEEGTVPYLGPDQHIRHDKQIFLRNNEEGQHQPFEAMACLPSSDTHMLISSASLQELTPNAHRDDEVYSTAIQVDSQTISPDTETPWGQLLHSRSVVTDGGMVRLYESD